MLQQTQFVTTLFIFLFKWLSNLSEYMLPEVGDHVIFSPCLHFHLKSCKVDPLSRVGPHNYLLYSIKQISVKKQR